MTQAKIKCRSRSRYGNCGRQQHKADPLHLVPIGGGSDPIADPAVFFAHGRGITPGYRSTRIMPSYVEHFDLVQGES